MLHTEFCPFLGGKTVTNPRHRLRNETDTVCAANQSPPATRASRHSARSSGVRIQAMLGTPADPDSGTAEDAPFFHPAPVVRLLSCVLRAMCQYLLA